MLSAAPLSGCHRQQGEARIAPAVRQALAAAEWSVWVQGGPERFEALLSECLWSGDPRLRRAAVRSVLRTRSPRAGQRLAERLHAEDDPDVRREIVWALGRLEDARAAPLLRQAARDEDPGVRAAAALALACCDEDPAREVSRLLRDPAAEVRFAAVLAAVRRDDLDPGDGFSRLLASERNERVRWALFKALSRRPKLARQFRPALVRGVLDRNHLVGIYSLAVLPELGGSGGFEEALALAGDEGRWWLPRVAARRALRRWLERDDLPPALREAAASTLEQPAPAPRPRAFPEVESPSVGGRQSARPPRRRPALILEVASKGKMVIELYLDEAPQRAGALLDVVRRGAYRRFRPVSADPLRGLEIESRGARPTARSSIALPPEEHGAAIRRGTLIAPAEQRGSGRLLIAALPMPELEGRVSVLGGTILGSRLLDHITGEDVLSLDAE